MNSNTIVNTVSILYIVIYIFLSFLYQILMKSFFPFPHHLN